jgi:uncharacterized protein
MTTIRVLNRTRGTVLGTRVRLADRLAARVRGFLFRAPPATGEGILLSPCRAVHMYGVTFPLDVIFISEGGEVVAAYRDLAPWRRSRLHGSALHALEVPAGTIRATGTVVGDALSWATVNGDEEGTTSDSTPTPASASASTPASTTTPASTPTSVPSPGPRPAPDPAPRPARPEPVADLVAEPTDEAVAGVEAVRMEQRRQA